MPTKLCVSSIFAKLFVVFWENACNCCGGGVLSLLYDMTHLFEDFNNRIIKKNAIEDVLKQYSFFNFVYFHRKSKTQAQRRSIGRYDPVKFTV